jgi:hypothetical protein
MAQYENKTEEVKMVDKYIPTRFCIFIKDSHKIATRSNSSSLSQMDE